MAGKKNEELNIEKGIDENVAENIEVKDVHPVSEAEIDSMAKKSGEAVNEEKKVTVKIPIDPLNPKDEVVPVGINGYFWNIQRGKKVEIPESVYEILENAGYI